MAEKHILNWLEKVVELLEADTSDLKELAKIAGADPRTFYLGIDPRALDLNGQDLEGISFERNEEYATNIVRFRARVQAAGRQEERLALLLRELCDSPERRKDVVSAFPVLTVYERRVVPMIERRLTGSSNKWQFADVLYKSANDMYQLCFTERKGQILFYFARHLGHLPEMRQFVRNKLSRTYSHHILAHSGEIQAELESHREGTS